MNAVKAFYRSFQRSVSRVHGSRRPIRVQHFEAGKVEQQEVRGSSVQFWSIARPWSRLPQMDVSLSVIDSFSEMCFAV